MLIWSVRHHFYDLGILKLYRWDVTLALVSRRGLHIHSKYFDFLAYKQHDDHWSFYELTGCPDGLMGYLLQLAELAEQREIAAAKLWLSFDPSPVGKIECAIKEWQNIYFEDFSSEPIRNVEGYTSALNESDHEDECNIRADQYHCCEAWRQALLIYIQRVFHWTRAGKAPQSIKIRARRTLDHVRCCRQSSQTQKQLLLPVFLAGAEIMDGEMRQYVRDYCMWWAERSRYKMFCSVSDLLEKLWSSNGADDSIIWWGPVVDHKSGTGSGQDDYQYLFG